MSQTPLEEGVGRARDVSNLFTFMQLLGGVGQSKIIGWTPTLLLVLPSGKSCSATVSFYYFTKNGILRGNRISFKRHEHLSMRRIPLPGDVINMGEYQQLWEVEIELKAKEK